MKYAIVKSAYAGLYNEAGTQMVDDVFSGWMVMADGAVINGRVHIITWYGYKGYIEEKNLKYLTHEELTLWVRDLYVVTEAYADVHTAPEVRALACGSLIRGSFVKLKEQLPGGWSLICTSDGMSGYVRSAYICRRRMAACDEKNVRRSITETAMSYFGVQYRWGGKSSLGTDCSGLAFMSYMLNGIIIYRDARIDPEYPVKRIERCDLKEGDLIYWEGHVAVYIGNCRYIHATAAEQNPCVTINSLNPCDNCYRDDLAVSISECGSFFAY